MYKVKVASGVILICHFDQMLLGSKFPMPEFDNDNFRATHDINDGLNLCSNNVQLNVSKLISENVTLSNSQINSSQKVTTNATPIHVELKLRMLKMLDDVIRYVMEDPLSNMYLANSQVIFEC